VASKPFCPNPEQLYADARKILLDWAATHPASLGIRTSEALVEALKAAYPCRR
jgi:hypothetical protein